MDEPKRKMSKKAFGGYRLISVKDTGCSWEGLLWVKAKNLKAFDALSDEELDDIILKRCPKDIPMMCFPADGYPMVRSECKECRDMEGSDEGNCPFLFRYSTEIMYDCRLRIKKADDKIPYVKW